MTTEAFRDRITSRLDGRGVSAVTEAKCASEIAVPVAAKIFFMPFIFCRKPQESNILRDRRDGAAGNRYGRDSVVGAVLIEPPGRN
ncbi:hypothetical protein [Porphyrobacter sp. YT40]|uniref:hypothetical protein n=1 Tax=Porphyrobacter sp. YT40 TaxID=2547601 RepID=UPI001141E116|nr:hypothetical protein [Porphyrobacter sp. YT40]QDH32976.1 hypothetical protein E2E27_00680 [Porphyrobacter sp. YT40]